MTEIKICGLFRDCDIDYVNEARPGYAGFILQFPKSHRNISIPRAAELRKRLLPGIKAVGVFVNRPAEEILRAKETIGLDVIQLHGEETAEEIREIRRRRRQSRKSSRLNLILPGRQSPKSRRKMRMRSSRCSWTFSAVLRI